MKIKFGSIVTQGRGKLGGQVYSKNRSGAYVRNNAVPSNPQTPYQSSSRAHLAQFSQKWSALSIAQQNSWIEATADFKRTDAFGDQRKLSGKNLYTSLNKNLALVGGSEMQTAPAPADINAPMSITVDAAETNNTLDVAVELIATADHVVYVATPPITAGTNYVKNRFRVVDTDDSVADGVDFDLSGKYGTRFQSLAEDQHIFVGAYSINSVGQKSPMVTTKVKVGS